MIFEIGLVALLFAGERMLMSAERSERGHLPPKWYGITRGWWRGAFESQTSSRTLVNMIDCDQECELWKWDSECYYPSLKSDSLGVRIEENKYGLVIISIKKDDGKSISPDVSEYDDYILRTALNSWRKRKEAIDKLKRERDANGLLDDRVTKNYIDTIEMVEKRILKQDPEQADLLRALTENKMSNPSLIPTKQEQSEKTKALLDKYDNAYSDPVCIKSEYKKRVAKATLNRKKAKHDYF